MHPRDWQRRAPSPSTLVAVKASSIHFTNVWKALRYLSTCWYLRREHYLHAKNLREAAALHEQLLRQLAGSALLPAKALPRSPAAPKPLSKTVLLVLQCAIAAGWADEVAGTDFACCMNVCLCVSGGRS